jgi:hypothetical protein
MLEETPIPTPSYATQASPAQNLDATCGNPHSNLIQSLTSYKAAHLQTAPYGDIIGQNYSL